MRKIRILLFIIMLIMGFIFNGELYILYLDNFQEDYYQSSFSINSPDNENENNKIINDFIYESEKYNVDFFVINWNLKSANETDVEIYGTNSAIKSLNTKGVIAGKNKSLFFGTTNVIFNDFSKAKDVSNFDTFYYIGEGKDINRLKNFKAALIDKYGGGFPKLLGDEKETYMNLIAVWLTIFFLTLIITLYSVIYQKKEIAVRVILGSNLEKIFLYNVFWDTLFFSCAYILIPQLLSHISNVQFKSNFISLLFIAFLILNILTNAFILLTDFKKDLSMGGNGRVLLQVNYIIKTISTMLIVVVLGSNVLAVKEVYNLSQQRDFFNTHKSYEYMQLEYKMDNKIGMDEDDNILMNQAFYKKFQNSSLQFIDLTDNFNANYPVVLINKTSMAELLEENPHFTNNTSAIPNKEKIYIMIPNAISEDSKEYHIAQEICDAFFYDTKKISDEPITYNSKISLSASHREKEYKMTEYSNPIIIFNNVNFVPDNSMIGYDMYYACDTMYRITNNEFQKFISDYNLKEQIISKTNVYDVYMENWNIAVRNLKLLLFVSLLLTILEVFLIMFTVRLNYQFNSVELAIKKIHGYSLLKRNLTIFKISFISSLVGVVIGFIISIILDTDGRYAMVVIGIIFFLFETCCITYKTIQMEKIVIIPVLKGERI